ncbi:MAG TPA: monovalent cation/H(+) antiporter subunit G [Verrucomicrobiae bacterium]|nr:monovalent cation/H(+) antiporter subunit G [Verrucomicrobiae bacterium]
MDGVSFTEMLRLGLGGVLVAIGLVFVLGGAIGVLRFPDIYTRLHGAAVANPLGAVVITIGLAIAAPSVDIAVRLILLALLLAALGPVWSHVFASAAHAGGLAPVTGKYTAPRPGHASSGDAS